ncbi:nuclear transcription factor [Aureococcus anophagefferens]|uniref:Nuclear transcription factor n=1 Tax=Aureococcus anophagefferens TaxID=44056 RepID=A0ABR1G901_AURAN
MADAPPPGLPTLGAPAALSGALADFKEQDRFLPIANIARIMKGNLPDNAKISKDAKEIVQECIRREPLRIFLEKYREKVKLEPDATSARAKRARKPTSF